MLHGYYVSLTDDKILVERALYTYFIPYTATSEEKMKKLFHLFCRVGDNAEKSYIEIQKVRL